jgi:putative tryptophan/tyrosine transport system substrate-binding protein
MLLSRHTRRRQFFALIGGAATWPLTVRAQQPAMRVIGILSPDTPASPYVEALRVGLQELGYVDGRNVRYEYRWAEGNFERLPDLAVELVGLNVDVIVAFVTAASLAARKATAMIPIVMAFVNDPIGAGLIGSLAHPGGNVTGTAGVTAIIYAKQLELLREIMPNAKRFAVLSNPANMVLQAQQVRTITAAAHTLGVELQLLEARTPNDFEAVFAAIDREKTRALLILGDPLFNINVKELAILSVKSHLAALYVNRPFVDAGGLIAYGPDNYEISKHTCMYVDKILKGAKPADLPVEQPTKFTFVLNLKTAKALDIKISDNVLSLADEVIE